MVNSPARVEELRKSHSTLQLTDPKTNEQVLAVSEEELEGTTRQVGWGRMRSYAKVSERAVERPVSLRDETMHVRRRPVSRAVSVSDLALLQERSYEMTEVDEEAVCLSGRGYQRGGDRQGSGGEDQDQA